MNFGHQSGHSERRMNLTPLIDVVFLLLIFFMVTTTFEKQARLKLELPEASPQVQSAEEKRVVITVTEDGKFFVDNNLLSDTSAAALQAAVLVSARDDRDIPVVIRADANAAHKNVVRALDVITRLGFKKTAIATVPETPQQ